jgi:phosphoribosylformylglycinamidine synthase single chain form
MVSRDPMIGRFQVPVADCALTTAGFDTTAGEVMSLGERPQVALLDAAAASRLAIAEAVTNLAAAPIGALSRIKLSCNWMAAAGHPGEDHRLYAAVRAAAECAVALGIAIPVGKDSMSMRTVWSAPPATKTPATWDDLSTQELAVSVMADLEKDLAVDEASELDKLAREQPGYQAFAREQLAQHEAALASRRRTSADVATELAADTAIAAAVAGADYIESRIAGGAMAMPAPLTRPRSPTGEQRAVVSPVTLVVTAFGPVTDVRRAVTPELAGGDHELLLVDLGAGKSRLGGSALAQVYRQLGEAPPDLDEPKRLLAFYAAIQELVGQGKLTAYHDRSDGGLVVAALEMAFAAGLGLELDTSAVAHDPFAALFSEELGAVLEVAAGDVATVRTQLESAGVKVHAIGRAVAADRVVITHGTQRVVDTKRTALRARWSHVSHEIASRRDDSACAAEEHAGRTAPDAPGLTALLTFDLAAPNILTGARPRVAILREQGVNGQIEMAAAFTRAGFEAIDIHMTDLIEGRRDLADCRGAVACGGFSFGDVLGAGRGWASTFRYNTHAKDALAKFTARSDTFLLGVCNGCQALADLADQLPGAAPWPRFVRNRSEQFEARLVLVELADSPSLFFRGMAGSRIPIANAHGEGRAELDVDQLAAIEKAGLVAARFVDGSGTVANTYPANPNGSPAGIAALTTPDGRFTIMMPHPERVFRTVQLSWHPADWPEDSPWMRMFYNARAWVA